MENIEQKAIELIEKFEALAVELAPDALELGLFVARVAAAQEIVWLLIAIAIFVFSVSKPWPWFVLSAKVIREKGDDYWKHDMEFKYGLVGAMWLIASVISGAYMLALLSIWPFVGIFYPEVWIAKEVLGW